MTQKTFISTFIIGIMLLLPTVSSAQTLELCRILARQCREIEAFSKQAGEDNSDIIALCKERVDICKKSIQEIIDDPSMGDYVDYLNQEKEVLKEINDQIGETREEILEGKAP